VKAGKSGRMRSLHQFIDASAEDFAVRLYAGPIDTQQCHTAAGKAYRLLSLPYFLAAKTSDYIDMEER